jgi:hypothetical protein
VNAPATSARISQKPGADLSKQYSSDSRVRQRQSADRNRLRLSTDRVREIDDRRDEERNRDLSFEDSFELGDQRGRNQAAGETDDEPRQTVARAPDRRRLERLARCVRLVPDARHVVQVFEVFLAQHAHYRARRKYAEKTPSVVDDRDGHELLSYRDRSRALAVEIGPHGRRVALHQVADRRVSRRREDRGEWRRANELSLVVDDVDRMDAVESAARQARDDIGDHVRRRCGWHGRRQVVEHAIDPSVSPRRLQSVAAVRLMISVDQ